MTITTEPRATEPPAPGNDQAPSAPPTGERRRGPRLVAAGAALLLAAAGAYSFYALTGTDAPERPPVPTAAVTYEITGTGTADITYLATSEHGTATTEKAAALPWKKTVQVPVGQDPSVKIQLPQQGGEATCALAVRNEHKQRATASGVYGRATCTTSLAASGH